MRLLAFSTSLTADATGSDGRLSEMLVDVDKATVETAAAAHARTPFYSKKIADAIDQLTRLAREAMLKALVGGHATCRYQDVREAHRKIEATMGKVMDAVRQRVEEWEQFDVAGPPSSERNREE